MSNQCQKLIIRGEEKLAVYSEYKYKDALKSMESAYWEPTLRAWILPYTRSVYQNLIASVPGIETPESVMDELAPPMSDTDIEIPPHPPMPLKKGITPYKHQEAAYALALKEFEHGTGFALLMEMGTGKTLAAIAIACRLFLQGKVSRVLVTAPLAVVPVWPSDVASFAGVPVRVQTLEGDKKHKLRALQSLSEGVDDPVLQIAVINYESSWRLKEELMKWRPDMVICDESQRIKEPTSAQSKGLHEIGARARYRLILTGTPVTNSPLDFYSQYKFLDPDIFGPSWYAFRSRYAVIGTGTNHGTGQSYTQVIGYKNLAELTEKAHRIAFRITKKDALDLPPEVDERLYCELEPEAKKAYDSLRKEAIAELEGLPAVTAQHVIVRLLRLSQICGGFVRTDIQGYEDDPNAGKLIKVSSAKQKLFQETIDELLSLGKKVVVFARFTAEVREICSYISEKYGEDSYRLIDGSVASADRGPAVADFQKNPEVKVFVAQIQTAGLGITLTAADTAIFYSYDFSLANYEQAKARIHRIGQNAQSVTYIHLCVKDSIDEDVLLALSTKRDISSLVVDNWKQLLQK